MSAIQPFSLEDLSEAEPSPAAAIRIDRAFTENIAPALPGYEVREQQLAMARLVARGLEEHKHVIAEAGTGSGKSFAVLVPAIFHATEEHTRVIVATATIALQEQYATKDLPFLRKVLGVPFTFALAKGKANYLCLERLEEELRAALFTDKGDDLHRLAEWAGDTLTGDRAELDFEPSPQVWSQVCGDEDCTGSKCAFADRCFYLKARAKLEQADIIVTNHHLYFIDLAVQESTFGNTSLLPEHGVVVFDEAHHVEDVARKALGTQVTDTRVLAIIRRARNLYEKQMGQYLPDIDIANSAVFAELAKTGNGQDRFVLGPSNLDARMAMAKLYAKLQPLKAALAGLKESDSKAEALHRRVERVMEDIHDIEDLTPDSDFLPWVEVARAGQKSKVTLNATPIAVGKILGPRLFGALGPTAVLTSATLAVNGRFDYLRRQVGVGEALELVVDSPFDFRHQALLYVPDDLPDPQRTDFHEKLVPFIEEILLKTDGRAFVLFTSFRGLNEVYERLASRLRWTVLRQGDRPKQVLIDEFKHDGHAVLFGTTSFWEGISIDGEALSCVIIDKLPFAVPTDPVGQARAAAVKRGGGNDFSDLAVPEAIIRLKQGFGRLIRTRTDRGIVAILDSRIRTKPYGRRFLASLPDCRHVNRLDNIELFLEGGAAR